MSVYDMMSMIVADGSISVKADAVEADLFKQSVQMRRWKSWTGWKTKALLQQHSFYLEK